MPLTTPPTRPTHRRAMNSSARPGPCFGTPKRRIDCEPSRRRLTRRVAGRAQGAAGQGEGAHPGARRAEHRAPHAADGRDRQGLRLRGARRRGRRCSTSSRAAASSSSATSCSTPSWDDGCPSCTAGADEISHGLLAHLHARDTTLGLRRPRAAGQDRALQGQAGAGPSPGTRPTAATSTTTSTSRSTSRWRPSTTTTGRRRSTRRRARAHYSRAISRSSCPARAASCATATRLPHLLELRARRRDDRRLVLLPRPDALGRQEEWEEPKGRAVDPHGATPDFAT